MNATPQATSSPTAAAVVTGLTGLVTTGVVFWMDSRWWGEPVYAYERGLSEPVSATMVAMMAAALTLGVLTAVGLTAVSTRRARRVTPASAVLVLLTAWAGLVGATLLLTPPPTSTTSCLEYVNDPWAPLPATPCD